MGFNTMCSEIEATMPLGLCGLDQLQWGGQAGGCWEVWKLSPCCGAPDCLGALLCILHWTCFSPCAMCKLYATSLSDHCSVWPHCICVCCLCCAGLFTRYNLRKKVGVRGNIIGDFVCLCCCGPCACCQELRSVAPGGWRFATDCVVPGIYVPGCRLLR